MSIFSTNVARALDELKSDRLVHAAGTYLGGVLPSDPALTRKLYAAEAEASRKLGAGLLAQVNTAVANMPGAEGDAARIEWEYAQEVRRDSPLVAALSAAFGWTGAQLDDLFTEGAKL